MPTRASECRVVKENSNTFNNPWGKVQENGSQTSLHQVYLQTAQLRAVSPVAEPADY